MLTSKNYSIMENKLTFIDLFAGCGGLSEGFLQSGHFEGLAHVEWELPMIETLRKRLVSKWNHSDDEAKMRTVYFDIQKTHELINGNWNEETKKIFASQNHELTINKGLKGIVKETKVDVIIGGPPCQAYSIHGRATDKNSMQHDYRNFLFESFAKIVDEFKPEIFVFENVPGILTAKPGGVPIKERIYNEFDKIGYKILSPVELNKAIFDCSEFQIPQNRKRVLIIGIKKTSKHRLNDFYKKIFDKADKKNKKTVRDAIGNLPEITPLIKPLKIEGKNISHVSNKNNVNFHIPRYHNIRDIKIFKKWVEEKMNYIPHHEKVKFYEEMTSKNTLYSKYRSLEWDKQSYTIVAHLQKDGLMFIHPDSKQARSITIKEASLLMTFPDDYEFCGSNAICYKMIGNAVPVLFAKCISESIFEVINNK